jgi:UDP-N-acetylmuramyl pentapeptide phosphotransferase/UDP-N-acetylglucosamine-1-phosphate transferase
MVPLETILKYPVISLSAMVTAILVTPLWQRFAKQMGYLDQPSERKLHKKPMPVGGGVAVALAFHVGCAVIFLFPWKAFAGQISISWWYRFAPLSLGVLLLGLIDDRSDLSPRLKLMGQVVLGLLAYALGIRLQNVLGVNVPEWVNLLGTVLWFLVMMNAFNLIDGIDGLAAGIGVIASVGIGASLVFRKSPGDVLLFLALAGACLGFLRYNFYPAQVFLGDTGSLFIGFTLAALSISTSSKGPAVAVIGMPLLAIGIPLFDSFLAVWRRCIRKYYGSDDVRSMVKIRNGDSEHLHHRLLITGHPHSEVAWLLYAGTGVLSVVGVVVSIFYDRAIGILALGFMIAAYTVLRHLAWVELQDSGAAILRGIRRPVRRNRTLVYYMVFDVIALNFAWLASVYLLDVRDGDVASSLKALWLDMAAIDVVVPFLFLILSRSYSRVWYLARVAEYASTGMAVIFGVLVACALNHVIYTESQFPSGTISHHIMMAGIAVPLIVGVRAAFRVVQDMMQLFQRCTVLDNGNRCQPVLIWGAGYRTTLFLKQEAFRSLQDKRQHTIGIFCDDEAMVGHYVHGVKVYGGLDTLRHFAKSRNVETVYIVEAVSDSRRQEICEVLAGLDVRVIQWDIVESECYA